MSTDPAVGAIRAWVIPAQPVKNTTEGRSAYVYPWSLGFVEELRLIPQSSTDRPGGMGDASFQLLRKQREESGSLITDPGNVVTGSYVCITAGMGATSTNIASKQSFDSSGAGLAKVLWWGWLSAYDVTQIAGTTDHMGTVSALGLGHLLDGTTIKGFAKAQTGGGYALAVNTPPTANFAVADGAVIGNALLSQDQNANSVFAFAPLPTSCGQTASQYWTRWRLLNHIALFCTPAFLPKITIVCADGSTGVDPSGITTIAGYLNDTSVPEIYDLRDLTFKGALDMLIPRSRGFNWKIVPTSASVWTVTIYTEDADGSYAPKNTPADVDLSSLTDVKNVGISQSSGEDYDEVVVQGEPIVIGVTVGFPDGNLTKGWTSTQETQFLDGAKNESGDGGYSSWTNEKKVTRNDIIRQSPLLERVFTTFGLYTYNTDDVLRKSMPGTGAGGSVPLVPSLTWYANTDKNGNVISRALQVSDTISRTPYLPTARFTREIPWPIGVKADGTDTRDATQKANPDYWPLRAFRYLASPPSYENYQWVDLRVYSGNGTDPAASRGAPAVEPDDRSPAVRIKFKAAEMLAKAQWTGSPGISNIQKDGSADPSTNQSCLDYTTLVLTVGIGSDQRVEVTQSKPGVQSSQVRRRLIIKDQRLKCWFMPYNTILGIKTDGTPDRVTAGSTTFAEDTNHVGYLVRNDFPIAQRICDMAAGWAFQRRTSLSITRARPDQTPSWAVLGTMIGKLIEAQADAHSGRQEASVLANTVVESISRSYDVGSPSMSISTSVPERPDLTWRLGGASGGPSPTSGGSVSAVGGGTIAQQVQDVRQAQTATDAQLKRIPLLPAIYPTASLTVLTLKIIDGQTVYSNAGTTYYGINWSSSAIATVPSAYDPNSVSSTAGSFTAITGIGRAQLFVNGTLQAALVLVVHQLGSSPFTYATVQGDTPLAGGQITIPTADGTSSIQAYTMAFP